MGADLPLIHWGEGESDLGPFRFAVSAAGVHRLSFVDRLDGKCDATAALWCAALVQAINQPWLAHSIALQPAGTAFQKSVWQAVGMIPLGETRTYQDIALMLGWPRAARAVGAANAANPIAVLIPCHRLVRGSGALAGYAYGLDRKQALLDKERQGRADGQG